MADALDLGSSGQHPWGFESPLSHHTAALDRPVPLQLGLGGVFVYGLSTTDALRNAPAEHQWQLLVGPPINDLDAAEQMLCQSLRQKQRKRRPTLPDPTGRRSEPLSMDHCALVIEVSSSELRTTQTRLRPSTVA